HEVGFALTSAGRNVLQCPPAATPRDRLFQIYGDRSDLVEVRKEAGGLKLSGVIAALAEQGSSRGGQGGPTRGPQHLFINRRIVKDRTIAHAIIDAYSVASIKERSPEVHLFIEMALDAVDVNVHPTKAEVRFRDQSLVHEVVRRALMDALGSTNVPLFQLGAEVPVSAAPVTSTLPGVLSGVYPNRWTPPATPVEPGASFARAASTSEAVDIKPLIPLGQFRDTFIVAIDDDGIAIIDQHVAHERVLFERVMEKLTAGGLESQRLLMPMLMDLAPSAFQAL